MVSTVSNPEQRTCTNLLSQYDPQLLDAFKVEMSYGIERFFLLSYCLACCWPGLSVFGSKTDLRVVRQWAELDFVFPDESARQRALQRRYYVPGNSVPIDVDVQHRRGIPSRIFVTIPRFDEGRPITLGTLDEQGRIAPYPDYSYHDDQGNNCNGLTSVFRVAIDQCQRLWVMDTGKIGDNQVCPPQLVAFSLLTDAVIYRHVLDKGSYTQSSLFITPVVDIRMDSSGECADTFVYVADVSSFAIVVVDVARGRSWRITHKLFFPYPNRGTITVDGESFDLMDGIMGMALSPARPGLDRFLYFHALAATTENVVRTSVLRNDSFIQNSNAEPNDVSVFPAERPSQSSAEAIDRNGIMFFGLMEPPSIWCWNTATEYTPRNFYQVAINRETLQFASGVKIVDNLKGEQELWVLTSSFQRVMTGTLRNDRTNFRIHAEKIDILLASSPCRRYPKDQSHGYHANRITPVNRQPTSHRYGAVSYL